MCVLLFMVSFVHKESNQRKEKKQLRSNVEGRQHANVLDRYEPEEMCGEVIELGTSFCAKRNQ